MGKASPKLIIRADDYGVTAATNSAIIEGVRVGTIRNIGILAVGPALEQQLHELREAQDVACLGLHLAINSEWSGLRWGPLAAKEEVPSLLDPDGCFLASTQENFNHTSTEDIIKELEAQFARLLGLGLRVHYADTHMGFHWLPGVRAAVVEFCRRHNLIFGDNETFPKLKFPKSKRLEKARPSAGYLLDIFRQSGLPAAVALFHPAWNSGEEERFFGIDVAAERQFEAEILTNPDFVCLAKEQGVCLARFDEVL